MPSLVNTIVFLTAPFVLGIGLTYCVITDTQVNEAVGEFLKGPMGCR